MTQKNDIVLKIKKVHNDSIVPTRAYEDDSGLDLHAYDTTVLAPGETKAISTGIAFGIPKGMEIQVRPRSGMSLKTGIRVANSPGTIDAGFIAPVGVILHNAGTLPYIVKKGDRIAQAVLCPVIIVTPTVVESLEDTDRGSGAFGSTGV